MNADLQTKLNRLIAGLKSSEDDRARSVQELFRFVDRELKEVSMQSYLPFLNKLCKELLDIYENGDIGGKKGAVIAMGCLLEVDFMSVNAHCRGFSDRIRNRSAPGDVQLIAFEARLMGQLGLVLPCDIIEEIKSAYASIARDGSDHKRQSSIVLLREFILNAPTSFYPLFPTFVEAMLSAFRDRTAVTRELASLTLQSAFELAIAREQRRRLGQATIERHAQTPSQHATHLSRQPTAREGGNYVASRESISVISLMNWFSKCLGEALRPLGDISSSLSPEKIPHYMVQGKKLNRDEWIHGSLLLLTELFTCALPQHQNLLTELNQMAGTHLFYFLTEHQSDGAQAVRTVIGSRWSFSHASTVWLMSGGACNPVLANRGFNLLPEAVQGKSAPGGPLDRRASHLFEPKVSDVIYLPYQRILLKHLNEIWPTILSWLKLRNQHLTIPLLRILPLVVALKPGDFLETEYQHAVMEWLFQCINKGGERPMALITIALIGYHVGVNFATSSYMPQLFNLIRSYLPTNKEPVTKKRSDRLETAAILSVGLMAKSLGSSVHDAVKQVLDSLFASGLSQPLISTCQVITEHVPQLRKDIKEQILRDITAVLDNKSDGNIAPSHSTSAAYAASNAYHLFPMPNVNGISSLVGHGNSSTSGVGLFPISSPNRAEFGNMFLSSNLSPVDDSHSEMALALRTLGSFNFEGRPLDSLVDKISKQLISVTTCESKEIRLEAVKTCAHLMLPWLKSVEPHQWHTRSSLNTVADILGKLLTVGISDPDPNVRRCVFESIDPGFDPHLAQAEHLSSLFLALRDEVFEIRCLVIQRLGRLSVINPACVQPSLRKVLLHTLIDLANSGSTKHKEQSALLIACLITAAPRFFTPYAEPVLQILVPRIRQALPASMRAYMTAAGFTSSTSKSVITDGVLPDDAIADYNKGDTQPLHTADLIHPQATTMLPGLPIPSSKRGLTVVNAPVDMNTFIKHFRSKALNINADSGHPGYPDGIGALWSSDPSATNANGLQSGYAASDMSTQWTEPTAVVMALFTALGRLSAVAPAAARLYLDEFIPILCSMMEDSSSHPRRSIAVWTLSTLVSNTGSMVSTYRRHPQLLQILLNMLKREESKEIRQEVLRALGVLGALDPFKYKLYTGQVDTFGDTGIAVSLHEADDTKDVDTTQSELVIGLSWENREEFFSICALFAMIRMLRDPTLQSQYEGVVRTIVYVLGQLGRRAVDFLRHLMPDYLQCLDRIRDWHLQAFLIRQLGAIMNVVRLHTKEFATEVVDLVLARWWTASIVRNACIRLLSPLSSVLGADFRAHLTRLIPVILRTLHTESCEKNLIDLLEILPQFGYTLEDHAHILVPAITNLLEIPRENAMLNAMLSTADAVKKPVTITIPISFSNPSTSLDGDDQLIEPGLDASSLLEPVAKSPPRGTGKSASVAASTHNQASSVGGLTAAFTSQDLVGSIQLRLACLECLARLTDQVDLDDLSGQIVHPICRLFLCLASYKQYLRSLLASNTGTATSSLTLSSLKAFGPQLIQSCDTSIEVLQSSAIDCFTGLLMRMGQKFKLLLPLVEKVFHTLNLRPTRFYMVLGRVEKGAYLPTTGDHYCLNMKSNATLDREKRNAQKDPEPQIIVRELASKGVNLERAWRSPIPVSRDDWNQWLKTQTAALLRESPNASIRACGREQLMPINPAISRTLFNAAFVSCWPLLTSQTQDLLIATLEDMLNTYNQAPEVSQAILNLEEFMAHVDKYSSNSTRVPLPLSLHLLADRAMKNRAYAKALYYKEQEFLEEVEKLSAPTEETVDCLLTIYSKLQLEEAATGVMLYATRHLQHKLTNEGAWREKLQDWKLALVIYENKLKDERIKEKTPMMLGRMRCLRALGQWQPLNTMVAKTWDQMDNSCHIQMAPIACSAAWVAQDWSHVERYVSVLPADQSFDGAFYRAVLAIHRSQYEVAYRHIATARTGLDADLTAMADESYDRAYTDLVGTQLLSEAEEVIEYKLVPERRYLLRDSWRARLQGCQSVVEDWGQLLQLRSLVLQPEDDLRTWLRFVGLCRRSGRFVSLTTTRTEQLSSAFLEVYVILTRQLLQNLLGQDPASLPQNEPIKQSDPATVFAYTKLLWATGARDEAVTRLCVLVTRELEPMLSLDGQPPAVDVARPHTAAMLGMVESLDRWDPCNPSAQAAQQRQELRTLMAKCCLRLGSWYSDLYIQSPSDSCTLDSTEHGFTGQAPTAPTISAANSTAPMRFTGPSSAQSSASQPSVNTNEGRKRSSICSPLSYSGVESSASSTGVNVPQAWGERQGFVIQCYDVATKHAPSDRFAWQSWAMANYAVFKHLDTLKAHIERAEMELIKSNATLQVLPNSPANASPIAQTMADLAKAKSELQYCMELHAAPSVHGFVNSISLSPSANLQDSLRLINLLFQFGHLAEIREVIREGLTKIRLSNWLLVIQQLLARIDTPREHVASIIIDLLISVGQSYPQSMVYPLVLAFKSGGSDRRRYNANRILYSMEDHSPRLVSEAFLLNEELIRLSITWVEMWSESLEDASRVYFGDKDIMKMFRILHPLHQMMDRGHETNHEATFLQEHGAELANRRICCETYEKTLNKVALQQAWEGYYTLYRRFTKQVNEMNTLELCIASPRLHEYGKDWQLAVPGSYEPHRPLVRVAGIENRLSLMTSKQHPRKLSVQGSDGHQYMFLLKGHEDTRQDERVMQFFGLVNTLLMNSQETLRRNLTIQRMSVIPLSTNTGLIGWVPNSDTLHVLIREYREKTQTMLNKENRGMFALAPDFDRLNVIQKTEVFEAGLRESSGRDLANILWLKSHSSEAWFERRTNFVRSMATMSMVGYILGLGDRHPSNIMLSRETGKVVHIDFGDCFEVAMMREKFPEKVPFRLTRMIIAAMEVTGIDGVYRQTCEMVMALIHQNRESLMAVLEAFIHDPLLQWVLLENRKEFAPIDPKMDEAAAAAGVGGGMAAAMNRTKPMAGNGEVAPGGAGLTTVGQPPTKGGVYRQPNQHYHHHRQYQQNLGAQTTTARRPTDRSGGLAPANDGLQYQQLPHHAHHPQVGAHRRTHCSPKRVFTNPNHPESSSLRDPYKVNQWRHHLCNGPWFGCYETAKRLRKEMDSGHIIVERQGLQGFIFSAKQPNDGDSIIDNEVQPTALGNTRARDVMERIRKKLTGTEREQQPHQQQQPMEVAGQVDYLIREATSNQNLCQMYIGWCAFW